MAAQLLQNFGAVAVRHRFGDEVADPVRMQGVSPEHLHVLGLAREMGLMVEHERHQPVRVFEGHQSARARLVAGESSILSKKAGVRQVTVKDSQQDSGNASN